MDDRLAGLLERARSGDRAAFDDLQRDLQPSIQRFVHRLVGACDRQEEISQEAFLALYLNLGRVDRAANLRPFLYRIVRNLCYDELRRRGRFDFVSLDEQGGPASISPPIERPPHDEQVHWTVAYARVQAAMERLPEPQRQALILRFEEEMSYPEIAESMGTDVGTVKSRIHYARSNLRRLLGPRILRGLGIEP